MCLHDQKLRRVQFFFLFVLPLLQALIRVVSFFCFYFLLNAPKAFGARLICLCFFYFHQVIHFTNHTKYLRSSFYFFSCIHLIQTKCFQCFFLTLWSVDGTFY